MLTVNKSTAEARGGRQTYDVARQQCRKVTACADGVGRDVGALCKSRLSWNSKDGIEKREDTPELCNDERKRDEPHPEARSTRRVPIQEPRQQIDRRPDRLPINSLGRRAHNDPHEAREGEGERDGEELRQLRGFNALSAGGEVRGVPVNKTHASVSAEAREGERKEKGTNVTSVAILLMQDIKLLTIAHPSADPWTVAGWLMMGPTPWALTMHQTKKVIPAIGATMDFRVKRWRLRIRSVSVVCKRLKEDGRTSGGWETR